MAGRIIIVSWCVFCLILSAVYTGNIVAFTTVDKPTAPFTTFRELAEQTEYSVGAQEGTYGRMLLASSNDTTFKMIYQKIIQSTSEEYTHSYNSSLESVLNKKFVLIGSNAEIKLLKSKTCDLVKINERFSPSYYGYTFPINSPLLKLFNKNIVDLTELGIRSNLEKKLDVKPMQCPSKEHHQFELNNLKTILVICAAAVLVACLVLIGEIYKKK